MNMKAAIFDMDGTLVDSLMLWDTIWSAFGKRYLKDESFTPDAEDDKQVRTLTLKDAMQLIHDNYRLGENGEELLAEANGIIKDFYANRVALKDGVAAFLEHCKNEGVKMCIASATAPDLIHTALKHCGIETYFLKVFSCGDIGKGKDQPDIFLQAAAFLDADISEIWVFEDSLTAIETAVNIGMPTVGIYDKCNYGQDKIKELATAYIGPSETLLKII